MHGLINRSIENFLRRSYGPALWAAIAEELDMGEDSFEPMFIYDDVLTERLIEIAAGHLGSSQESLLEDIGTFLAADPSCERVRRLLRFGGADFEDFLHSLEDMQGRAHLAVEDLDLPSIEVDSADGRDFLLRCRAPHPGFGQALLGLLRAMADDYGALVVLDHLGRREGCDIITVRVLEASYAKGRGFKLAATG